MRVRIATSCAATLGLALCGVLMSGATRAEVHPDPRAYQHIDTRFNHNHAYPVHGYAVTALPHEHYEVVRGGTHYYVSGGVWYAPHGPGYVVVAAPVGVFVPVLPAFYTTVWFGGLPYYYANDSYYAYRGPTEGYEVVDPPNGAPAASAAAPDPPAAPAVDPYVYPKNGQSDDQQARDRYECHRWAAGESGYDPTVTDGGVPPQQLDAKRADYARAMGACLEGRGYSVK
jgi:hypothetical protein